MKSRSNLFSVIVCLVAINSNFSCASSESYSTYFSFKDPFSLEVAKHFIQERIPSRYDEHNDDEYYMYSDKTLYSDDSEKNEVQKARVFNHMLKEEEWPGIDLLRQAQNGPVAFDTSTYPHLCRGRSYEITETIGIYDSLLSVMENSQYAVFKRFMFADSNDGWHVYEVYISPDNGDVTGITTKKVRSFLPYAFFALHFKQLKTENSK